METEDAQQSPATVTSRAVTISVWVIVLLVVYVASVGPACWLQTRGFLTEDQLDAVYLPLNWLYVLDDASWFARGLNWWLEWWRLL